MAQPIRGYDGSVTIADVATGFVNNWEVSLETEEKSIGPFIGDGGLLYTYTTSRKLTGKLEATIPTGKDAGQTVLISGALNSSIVSIVLATTGGYTVTIPSGTISAFSMSQDASESVKVNFDFSSSGSFTVA
ncbi:MAG TPA: hypothetical protein VL854_08330 [Nitrososphaeraceae archaeon]|jgi:hypothetical protein|nr:hypothetical protein [Nitrososphaeraceae archaeon]